MRCSTSRASLVPRWAFRPPAPRTNFISSFSVYWPEKHRWIRLWQSSPPLRSGANMISSSRTPSTILPPMNSRAEAPPPKCSTMNRHSSSGLCMTSFAQRMAMARQLREWPSIRRCNMGMPVMRVTGVISSTATGSYT